MKWRSRAQAGHLSRVLMAWFLSLFAVRNCEYLCQSSCYHLLSLSVELERVLMLGCVLFLDALVIPLSVVFLMVEEGSAGLALPYVI
jgi:hypothetical protein